MTAPGPETDLTGKLRREFYFSRSGRIRRLFLAVLPCEKVAGPSGIAVSAAFAARRVAQSPNIKNTAAGRFVRQRRSKPGSAFRREIAAALSFQNAGAAFAIPEAAGLPACCAIDARSYEWGYTYGPAQAVAPLPNVRAVLDYAVTEIPPEKIFLGVPNYGYDWTLPYVQGVSKARSLSNQQAIDLALQRGAAIEYDASAASPHFNYIDQAGQEHEVWFEDARSMEAKLRLIAEYGFRGAGYWNVMRPFSQTWLVLASLYDIA